MSGRKVYLGDGAYASVDDRGLVLTAEDGIQATDTVVLDDDGVRALLHFITTLGLAGRALILDAAEAAKATTFHAPTRPTT